MALNTQIHRPMAVTAPLGPDKLLLVGFSGHEGLSQLFTFHLDVLAEGQKKSEKVSGTFLGSGMLKKVPDTFFALFLPTACCGTPRRWC
jgi:hypothetical protein